VLTFKRLWALLSSIPLRMPEAASNHFRTGSTSSRCSKIRCVGGARYRNYWMFQRQSETSGAILYTCEIAFGGRDFEITEPNNPRHLQLRASTELWQKENALNLLGQRLPPEAKYLAWIDADVQFARPDWAQETLHLLQHYDVIQMFSHIQNIGPSYEPLTDRGGFLWNYVQNRPAPHFDDFAKPRTAGGG